MLRARLQAFVLCFLAVALVALPGCFATRPNEGGGQKSAKAATSRHYDPAAVALPDGYQITPVATGLTYPTAALFDDRGGLYVIEAGYSYGEDFPPPRLLRIENGQSTVVATAEVRDGMSNGPWTGAAYHDGAFYVCEGGVRDGGRVLRIDASGAIQTLVDGLPTMGDHHLNGPVIHDGYIYVGVGTATNSAVVGPDNAKFGWLKRQPKFHDIPARDITLTGQNFESDNPLTPETGDKATTGAFVPFGTATTAGQVIRGQMPCNGAVLRLRLPATTTTRPATTQSATTQPASQLELVAWGLRNPFGLAMSEDKRLFVVENSYDVRGSRPVWGTGDLLWAVDLNKMGTWFGWPDFFAGERMEDNPGHFRAPGEDAPMALIASPPNTPPRPVAWLGVHASACGIDFDRAGRFGHRGNAFVAQFGDMTPGVGKLLAPVGFKVVHVDVTNGVVYDFAVNRGKENGPASKLKNGGLERPIACRFDPSGESLYIVDFGVLALDAKGKEHPARGTGAVWKITRTNAGSPAVSSK